jgi:RNA polymerase sigma-70 factor (ECF subfamily)
MTNTSLPTVESIPAEIGQADTGSWTAKDDRHLFAHISQGNKAAMTEFVARYYHRITDFAFRHLNRVADAEDIAQETFIRVWHKASHWQDREVQPHSWLYRITYNLCIDELRKRKPECDVDEQYHLADDDSPEGNLYQQQKDKLLAAAMRSLSENQRTAIVLCNYQGFSNRDAASVMDITVEALESLLARGRSKLRKQLMQA